jgi:tartrate dehydratase alpha subunit/fumarate hydratase class I-like protein
MASLTTTANTKTSNGLGPKTRIYSVNKGTGSHTQSELNTLVQKLTAGITKDVSDAVTVAGIAGTVGTDPLYIAVQGTGAVDVANEAYVADIQLALVASFDNSF